MSKNVISDYLPLAMEVHQFSLDFIEHNQVIKLDEEDSHVTIGITEEPLNEKLQQILGNSFRTKDIRTILIDRDDLTSYIGRELSNEQGSLSGTENQSKLEIDQIANDAPIINLVNSLLIDGVKQNVSDIHFECFSSEACVRFRVDGVLKTHSTFSRERFKAVSSRLKIMANLNIMETRRPQDGRITVQLRGISLDIRISVVPIAKGESLVLRLLNTNSSTVKSLYDLGFSRDKIDALETLSRYPHGLILVTGPTGSGKTTTLNAILNGIKSDTKKIITIEDPVEFVIDGIDQIQTNEEIELTFSTLLRRVLRQDPDVIMVGEIRDKETAELAVRASLTGHLVLSTLHTNDASSAITRLMNMEVPSYLIASVIRGVLAQRLVRKLCPACKERYRPPASELRILGLDESESCCRAVGCEKCNQTGYDGRMAVLEYFLNNKTLEEKIASGIQSTRITDYITENLLHSFRDSSTELLSEGLTTIDEIKRVIFFNAEI